MAQENSTATPVANNVFTIAATGSKSDGKTFWSQITKEQDGFLVRAFIVTTAPKEVGATLTIPTALLKSINWAF